MGNIFPLIRSIVDEHIPINNDYVHNDINVL